ncbi:hypothetical protein QAD02_021097 [Eretmocerus hayati]|uniref:Uncharacterized protein n=1 Tax=Eretmocerus hayati TaxID=131215 RepID=A0ACC2PPR6_9HYME|nr:hypothetical protein QAD02_021097 [Eretmocerus hayati]
MTFQVEIVQRADSINERANCSPRTPLVDCSPLQTADEEDMVMTTRTRCVVEMCKYGPESRMEQWKGGLPCRTRSCGKCSSGPCGTGRVDRIDEDYRRVRIIPEMDMRIASSEESGKISRFEFHPKSRTG